MICQERPNLSLSQPHWLSLPPGGELRPVVVDLLLGVAADDEGDCFGEFEDGAAVERGELLAVELEGDGEDFGGRVGSSRAVVDNFEAAGVFEYGEVKVDGFFGVRVEPEEGRDAGIVFEGAHRDIRMRPRWVGMLVARCSFHYRIPTFWLRLSGADERPTDWSVIGVRSR